MKVKSKRHDGQSFLLHLVQGFQSSEHLTEISPFTIPGHTFPGRSSMSICDVALDTGDNIDKRSFPPADLQYQMSALQKVKKNANTGPQDYILRVYSGGKIVGVQCFCLVLRIIYFLAGTKLQLQGPSPGHGWLQWRKG